MTEKKNKLAKNVAGAQEVIVAFIALIKEAKVLTRGVKSPLGKALPWVIALLAVGAFVALQLLEDGVF